MLQGIAVENVKAWHFATTAEAAVQVRRVTFHFQLNPPGDGYDYDGQPTTKVELDEAGGVQMLKAGAKVNVRSKRGETALMASAVTGMANEDLLDAGADVNAVNDVGMSALMLLAQRGEPDEMTTLLKAGADARKKDAAGRTALDYLNAANCGRPVVDEKDPKWMTVGYSRCNALDRDDYKKSKRLLIDAGARATRISAPKGM